MSESAIDHQQLKGAAWDIVDEAIAAYDDWMLDDDYDATGALRRIIERMRERRGLYRAPSASESTSPPVIANDQHTGE